ncbi:hypothetical protein JCM31739_10840 [Faecalimonas canis]
MFVERSLTTKGKEENITGVVTFPYNEDDVKERFDVKDMKELYFTDKPEGKLSVKQFNYIMCEAEDRVEKLKSQVDSVVDFLKKRITVKKVDGKDKKGVSDVIPLSFEDSVVWKYCMSDYKHKDENVKVWRYRNDLTILYKAEE